MPLVASPVPFTTVTPAAPRYTFPAFDATALNHTIRQDIVGSTAAVADPAISPD
jgi:hypothetical protein